MEKEKIVILGFGWVGQANALALARMGYEIFYYDVAEPARYYPEFSQVYEKIKSLDSPLQEEGPLTWYLICVGDRVLENGRQDLSLIKSALKSVDLAKGRIILRSTVLPDLLKELSFDYYLPEFLHEKNAVQECLDPIYFVIGGPTAKMGDSQPGFFIDWRDRSYKVFSGTPEEASFIKYLSNLWNSLRIAFVNEYGDIMSDSKGVNAESANKVLDFIFEKKSYLRYGKSFGGHCLPKDSLAFSYFHGKDKNVAIMEAMVTSNIAHKKSEKNNSNLQEWFSFWDYNGTRIVNPNFFSILWYKTNAIPALRFARRKAGPTINSVFDKIIGKKSLQRSRKIWDELATKNARYFTNIGTKSAEKVDEYELKEFGEMDYRNHVLDDKFLMGKLGDKKNSTVLEIGCGIGRMTEFFARDFKKVYGIDISNKMINLAKKRLAAVNNISFAVNDGKLIPFSNDTFNLAFSYLVFRHIPSSKAVKSYFKEIYRILRPGGVAKIELRTGPKVSRWLRLYGETFKPDSIKTIIEAAGMRFLKHKIDGPKHFWIWAEKS